MAWTKYQMGLAFMMLVTGSLNTLSTKWADRNEAVGSDGTVHGFDHPFLQAVGMFLGELSCLAVFHIVRLINKYRNKDMELGNQSFNPLIFLAPAMCDMCGTSTMYLGLTLTYASSFQMLRGLATVGMADILFGDHSNEDLNGIIAGDLLIITAQIIVAVQMVVEQKFVNKHNVPALQAVGWEGFFGFTVLGVLLIPMYYIKVGKFSKNPEYRLEDAIDGFTQLGNSWQLLLATIGNIVSIAFFNFSGISVTKEMSATTRMVLDSLRTVVIWGVSLALTWQDFQWLQLIGFLLLSVGMCLYNDIIIVPIMRKYNIFLHPIEDERRPLLAETAPSVQSHPSEVINA